MMMIVMMMIVVGMIMMLRRNYSLFTEGLETKRNWLSVRNLLLE